MLVCDVGSFGQLHTEPNRHVILREWMRRQLSKHGAPVRTARVAPCACSFGLSVRRRTRRHLLIKKHTCCTRCGYAGRAILSCPVNVEFTLNESIWTPTIENTKRFTFCLDTNRVYQRTDGLILYKLALAVRFCANGASLIF